MPTDSIRCPMCGAPLPMDMPVDLVTCSQCGSRVHVALAARPTPPGQARPAPRTLLQTHLTTERRELEARLQPLLAEYGPLQERLQMLEAERDALERRLDDEALAAVPPGLDMGGLLVVASGVALAALAVAYLAVRLGPRAMWEVVPARLCLCPFPLLVWSVTAGLTRRLRPTPQRRRRLVEAAWREALKKHAAETARLEQAMAPVRARLSELRNAIGPLQAQYDWATWHLHRPLEAADAAARQARPLAGEAASG